MEANERIAELEAQNAELQRLSMSQEFLSDAADSIFELFLKVEEEFDGSEYQQGKKDGLRMALAHLKDPSWADFNRGGGRSRDNYAGLGALAAKKRGKARP